MANLVETTSFDAGVYQIETTDPVLGGPGGIANTQAQALANRTKFLKSRVDLLEAGTTVPPGIATQAYVTTELNKRDNKQSVRAATTADITLFGTQTVDGVALQVGDRVLAKSQTSAAQNGIYVVSATAWTRALDADENVDVTAGMLVEVSEGTTLADTIWKLATNDPITLGTTLLTFADITTGYAPLASPNFTGNPTAPTAAIGDTDTSVATTEFATRVKNGLATVGVGGGVDVALNSAQYGVGIVNMTGALTASINVIFPSASGQWVVVNNTSGAFNLTVKTAAGAGVVVPQGSAIVVYCDGTQMYAASAAGQSSLKTQYYAPAAGTTSLTVLGGYTPGAVIVEKNGVVLDGGGIDYTATSGATITLTAATIAGDTITVYAFASFTVANAVLKSGDTMTGPLAVPAGATGAQAPQVQEVVKKSGDTMSGDLNVASSWVTIGAASSAKGGAVRLVDDTGTLRWTAGILAAAAATAWSLYDNVSSKQRVRVETATGNFGVNTSLFGGSNSDGFTVEPYVGGSTANFGHNSGAASGDDWALFRRNGAVLGGIFMYSSLGMGIRSADELPLATGGTSVKFTIGTAGQWKIAGSAGNANQAMVSGGASAAVSWAGVLGPGQTHQDVTASRSSGVTYTNSSGAPIDVHALINTSGGGSYSINGNSFTLSAVNQQIPVNFNVLNGATYSATGSITKWLEAR